MFIINVYCITDDTGMIQITDDLGSLIYKLMEFVCPVIYKLYTNNLKQTYI